MKAAFAALSLLLVVLLGVSLRRELVPPYVVFQAEYRRLDPEAAPVAGVRQLWNPDLVLVDRCPTCHVGIGNPRMQGRPSPYSDHPGDLLDAHPPEKFGCTPCHEGQGYATTTEAAHGRVAHWERPLLAPDEIPSACGKCHYENELFGAGTATADIYGLEKYDLVVHEGELWSTIPGGETLARGKALVVSMGCFGCHQYRGLGGVLGPDITYTGDKTVHDFDFTHVRGPKTVRNWLYEHFRAPREVSPETLMLDFRLTDQQANDLTILMMSFHRKLYPGRYTPYLARDPGPPAGGGTLYGLFCSGCHGREGRGGVRNENYVKDTIPALDTLADRMFLWSREDADAVRAVLDRGAGLTEQGSPPFRNYPRTLAQYQAVRDVIRQGNVAGRKDPEGPPPPLHMPSWRMQLSDRQIDLILSYLISLQSWDDLDEGGDD